MGNKTSSSSSHHNHHNPNHRGSTSSHSTSSSKKSLPQAALENADEDIKRFAEEALGRIFTFAVDDVKAVANFSHVNQRWQLILHRQQKPGQNPTHAMKLVDQMWRNLVVHSRPAMMQRCSSGMVRHGPNSSHRTTESSDVYQNSITSTRWTHSGGVSSVHDEDDDFHDRHDAQHALPVIHKRRPSVNNNITSAAAAAGASGRSLGSSVNSQSSSDDAI